MSTIQGKRKIRTVNIKLLNKLFEKSLEIINITDDENQFSDFSDLKDTLNKKYNKVIQLDEEITLLIEDEDKLENEVESSTELNLVFKSEISKINKELKKFDIKTDCNSTLNINNDLSVIQKMTYLRNLLKGSALSSISGLSLSNENYKIALDILKERYENKQNMISSHMRKLLHLLDNIEIQIRSLETLKITSEMYGPLLVPIILQKIPKELNLIIYRQLDKNSSWDVLTIINILKSELRAREQVSLNLNNSVDKTYTTETFFTNNNNYEKSNFNRNSRQFNYSKKAKENSYFDRNNPTNIPQFIKCLFCDRSHKSQYCKFITDIQNRKRIICEKHLCFKCLGSGHISKNCTSRIKCFKCGNQHHIALCLEKQNSYLQKGEQTAISSHNNQSILLQTASTDVFDINDRLHNCRILFDNCSQLSYISPDLKLKLECVGKKNINIKTFGNNSSRDNLEKVELKIKCLFGKVIKINCYIKDICAPLNGQYINLAKKKYRHLHNLRLADTHVMFVESNSSAKSLIKESMTSVWGVREMNECNYEVIDRFRHTIKYDNTLKRYNVNLPFKEDQPPLSDNFDFCIKRFKVHYLPHQPVLRNYKVTSKVRIVFDASSSVDGPSLNDCLYPGPSLTTSLYGIFLLFYAQKKAFVADIEKAFLQITLSPEDCDYARFLWFENINSLNKDNIFTQKIIPYRICRVLFGVTSSSFLLSATLITHAKKYLSDDPLFVNKLISSLHVDDLNSGADSIDSAINFYQKCQD
ncbi:uncharacterized protein LOC136094152 [Hydra vulgaris]|uniref:uncharacterized protein LOC136094152 n=1 Tax=Hydra vulgaris TaxID=6087 RepID=UPI0032EA49FA